MEITGKIIVALPLQSGISKNGNEWKKQEYVLETHDQYPKKICFQIFGADRINQAAILPGEELKVSIDIDSHEYQGRWFNSISAWKVERVDTSQTSVPTTPVSAETTSMNTVPPLSPQATPNTDFAPPSPVDDLPF
ncbi:MAG: DUF3127 domain-containing protein [Parabacteroides sp.]|nr:DUF3127 domain-containing protein [Parabacteroides sp.]